MITSVSPLEDFALTRIRQLALSISGILSTASLISKRLLNWSFSRLTMKIRNPNVMLSDEDRS